MRKFGLSYLFLIGLIYFMPSAWANSNPFISKLIPDEIPRMVISHYPDSTRFAHQQWLREVGGLFDSYYSIRMKFNMASSCSSLLEANQLYPLNRMLTTGYISKEQFDFLIRMGDRLNPAQFRFFELIKKVESKDLEGLTIDAERGDISFSVLPALGENVGLTQATVWVVGAQTTSSHVRFSPERMPWQLDDSYRGVKLDRDEIKLAWELGRGAQGEPGSMEPLLRAAAMSMLRETLAYGLKPHDGRVFMHALGPKQARLFKIRRSPKTDEPIFSTFVKNSENDEVMVANLQDFLDTFRPDQFSERIQKIVDLAKGRMDWFGAVEHLYVARDHFRQDLNLVSPNVPDTTHPIVLRNGTPTSGWFMAKVSERLGVYDVGESISKYLSSKRWVDTNVSLGRNADPLVPDYSDLAQQKVIGLSNFSESSAKAYPKYVKLVLLAAYFYWERTLRKEYPRETDQLLEMTRFVVNSSQTEVLRQAGLIPRADVKTYATWDYAAEFTVKDGQITLQPKASLFSGPGYLFDRRAILALAESDPALVKEARRALRKGNWQTQNMIFDIGVQ